MTFIVVAVVAVVIVVSSFDAFGWYKQQYRCSIGAFVKVCTKREFVVGPMLIVRFIL